MNSISDIDFRDLKPSMAKWLGGLIEDVSTHAEVVDKLKSYLNRLDLEQPSDADHAKALSHELASIGVWKSIDEQLFLNGLSSASPKKVKVLFSAAPLALEERLLKEVTTKLRGKRRHSTAVVARRKHPKLGLKRSVRFFTATFETKRVASSLKVSGASLGSAEKAALCEILDKKSNMYIEGCTWQVSVTQKIGTTDFEVGELTAQQHGLGIGVMPRIDVKMYKEGKAVVVRGNAPSPQFWPATLPGFGSDKRTED